MSKLKQLLEKATQKNEMRWRVYAYDPAKDNKLVYTSKTFDCINDAGIEKAELLKKNPDYTVEIVAESIAKARIDIGNDDIDDAYMDVNYAITRDTNYKLKDFKKESSQKNEDKLTDLGYKVGDTFIIQDLPSYLKGKTAKILSSPYHNAPIVGEYVVDCIELTTGKKFRMPLDRLPKHTNESADIDVKNPGVLEVPDGKKVDELPQSHFEKLVDKKGYAEVIRALTNLEVWNKDKNKSLSSWASSMADKLKKKFRPESAQKNEDYKAGDIVYLDDGRKVEILDKLGKKYKVKSTAGLKHEFYVDDFRITVQESYQKNEATFKPGDKVSVKSYYKDGNQFITLRNATIIKEITEKEAGQLDPAYNWKEPTGMKYYLVKLNTGSKKAVLANDLTLESAQKNESYTIQNVKTRQDAEKIIKDKCKPKDFHFTDIGIAYDGKKNIAQYMPNSKQLVIVESAQIHETRGYTVTVELDVPDNMNNRDIEDEVERLLRTSNKINVVTDVTATRR